MSQRHREPVPAVVEARWSRSRCESHHARFAPSARRTSRTVAPALVTHERPTGSPVSICVVRRSRCGQPLFRRSVSVSRSPEAAVCGGLGQIRRWSGRARERWLSLALASGRYGVPACLEAVPGRRLRVVVETAWSPECGTGVIGGAGSAARSVRARGVSALAALRYAPSSVAPGRQPPRLLARSPLRCTRCASALPSDAGPSSRPRSECWS